MNDQKLFKMSDIRRVGGTSAGSIVATLLAVGYSLDELSGILSHMNFAQLLSARHDYRQKFFALKQHLESKSQFDMLVFFLLKMAQLNLANDAVDLALKPFLFECDEIDTSIKQRYGIFSGNELFEWVKKKIKEKTGYSDMTFGDLNREIQKSKGSNYKHLYVTGVDLMSGRTFRFSHRHSPDLSIARAVRISASIPVIFEPVACEFKNQFGLTSRGLFVDGGLLDNYPVWMFDNTKYFNELDYSIGSHALNRETLGLRIVKKENKSRLEDLEMVDNVSKDAIKLIDLKG